MLLRMERHGISGEGIETGDRDSDPVIYNFFALCYNFLLRLVDYIIENEGELQMEKKLNALLSDLVVEYHKLQSFHWYLKGSHFFDDHANKRNHLHHERRGKDQNRSGSGQL